MKKLLGILVLGLLFCNTSFADSLRVVDGDTIVLNGEKIRFSGIDTPELKQTCMNGDEKVFCGKSAKMLLIKKIVKPLKKRYCQGTDCASSIKRTTKAPKDQNIPAIKTIKIAESTLLFFMLTHL